MISKSTVLHLRIPFSFFLLPVYLFALAISPNLNGSRLMWTFIAIHFFLYPASNAFNSYFDRDEKSIGGLRNPPAVKKELYWIALIWDLIAIAIGLLKVNLLFAIMLFVYGLASKAYSHPSIRLKKYPLVSWFIAGFFQGFFTFALSYIGINNFGIGNLARAEVWMAATLTSIMLWASYPMTQVYQHEEDSKRGDMTLSILVGIKGTFYFAMIFFSFSAAAFCFYFITFFRVAAVVGYLLAMLPVVGYFLFWMIKVFKDEREADYSHTMWLNSISALCLNLFFAWLWLDTSHIMQL